ncbi:hypothetical protein M501DRAFT_1003220 [Patellaria atrata CBS 101060]|uniref:ferric-chelate reductase (NADPH) n=1 Tax=Patellaria atrata CBS 101060 TaxID=1346257 RepID=A0A9P4VQF4_9PEZI|nr:hypothetical protein M501DRAFT_1003220 [Patellaria atrata CBS 101060]
MSHDHTSGMSMGSMSMGDGVPTNFRIQEGYWIVVGTFIAAATAVNLYNKFLHRQRLSAQKFNQPTPAKPKFLLFTIGATITAILRETRHASFAPISIRGHTLYAPTVGRVSLVFAYIIILVVLCFYKLDTNDIWSYEDIGYRSGFVSIAQLPLIFLLAGKNNIVGCLTGTSHERLNWLHRWTARGLFLTATIHMGYWFANWAPYDGFIEKKIRTDPITRKGVMSWAVLVWIVLSSMTPIRGWNYELFVLQHLVSFAVFIGFVFIHVPDEVQHWVWIPVGLFFFDRVVRALYILYINLSIFHPKQRKLGQLSGFWSLKAEFEPLPHNTTRITIHDPPISWKAGQYVFLSCHSLIPLQSHPFTIASIPADGKMEFLVKAEKGGTMRFFRHAKKQGDLPITDQVQICQRKSVGIEGPYGRIRPLRQFDSIVFFAGSTGATYTMPLLRDIVRAWLTPGSDSKNGGFLSIPDVAVTRHIRFVWVIKSRGQLGWFSSQLSTVIEDVNTLRNAGANVEVDISVYVTCDPSFTEEHKSPLSSPNPTQQLPVHGKPEEITEVDEKGLLKGKSDDAISIRQVDARSNTDSVVPNNGGACGPDGTCCCTNTIEDEAASDAQVVCDCNCGASSSEPAVIPAGVSDSKPTSPTNPAPTTRTVSSNSSTISLAKPLVHPHITLLSGRPQPRNIIRKSLEQALGESAVVVCGPRGLVSDVRTATVGLSDERAVHKGTGAQGVWLRVEEFGY